MPANQRNATEYNPNDLNLTLVASYQRRINASLERVWENVHDWEHLPWLHDSAFGSISLEEQGDWGWRTLTTSPGSDRQMLVELCVKEADGCYVARSYQDGQQISEIWTHLTPEASGDATDIRVEFHVPDVAENAAAKVGNLYLTLYRKLWDEDEEMMIRRHTRLNEQEFGPDAINLGSREALLEQLPLTVKLRRGEFRIIEQDGELLVYSTICPHLLGPLEDAEIKDSCVTCPWHGYQFDIRSRECVTSDRQQYQLARPPQIWEQDGELVLSHQAP